MLNPKRKRILIKRMHRQDCRCSYCGTETQIIEDSYAQYYVRRLLPPLNMATLDHVIPTSRGGTSGVDNVVLACLACNTEKGVMSVEDYIALVSSRKELNQYPHHMDWLAALVADLTRKLRDQINYPFVRKRSV